MPNTAYGSELTVRQREVLDFILRTVAADGFPPTRVELAAHFDWKSANAAEEHLRALVRKGAITITKGASRGITVVGHPPVVTRLFDEEVKAWRNAFPDFKFDGLGGRVVRLNSNDSTPQPRFVSQTKL